MFLSVSFIEDIIMQCLGLDVYTLSSCLLPWWGKRESSLSSPLSIKWVPTPRLFSTGRMSTCSHHVCCFYSMVEYSSLGSYAPQNLGGSFFFSLLLSLVILHISVLTYLCWLVGSGLWCSFFVATTAIPPSSFSLFPSECKWAVLWALSPGSAGWAGTRPSLPFLLGRILARSWAYLLRPVSPFWVGSRSWNLSLLAKCLRSPQWNWKTRIELI